MDRLRHNDAAAAVGQAWLCGPAPASRQGQVTRPPCTLQGPFGPTSTGPVWFSRRPSLSQQPALSQVVMMRPGLPRYPHGLDDLWGVRIAVDEGSINHNLLASLPESRRPALHVVDTRTDAIAAFERAEVDGVAGNHLTMRFMMGTLAENAI